MNNQQFTDPFVAVVVSLDSCSSYECMPPSLNPRTLLVPSTPPLTLPSILCPPFHPSPEDYSRARRASVTYLLDPPLGFFFPPTNYCVLPTFARSPSFGCSSMLTTCRSTRTARSPQARSTSARSGHTRRATRLRPQAAATSTSPSRSRRLRTSACTRTSTTRSTCRYSRARSTPSSSACSGTSTGSTRSPRARSSLYVPACVESAGGN
jgi:hypothetical protein